MRMSRALAAMAGLVRIWPGATTSKGVASLYRSMPWGRCGTVRWVLVKVIRERSVTPCQLPTRAADQSEGGVGPGCGRDGARAPEDDASVVLGVPWSVPRLVVWLDDVEEDWTPD